MRFTKKLVSGLASLLFVAACSEMTSSESALSGHDDAAVQAGDCTLTQGYWKNHPDAWPVTSLELGTVTYDQDALIAILKTPVKGNGLVALAHQLIAAKLNVAAGADDVSIEASIAAADALIGSLVVGVDALETSQTSELNGKLDAFNNGDVGPGHCGDHEGSGSDDEPCDEPVCGNGTVEAGEGCDDGNTVAHDGCSASCEVELAVCGNGTIEVGEDCDDGNTVSGDGCSSVCFCDCPH
jgi:cysteine-rich repeat protein